MQANDWQEVGKTSPAIHVATASGRSMIHNRLLSIADVADYLQTTESLVLREIQLHNLEAVYIGYDWRIEPSAVVTYIETRKTLTPFLSGRRFRTVEQRNCAKWWAAHIAGYGRYEWPWGQSQRSPVSSVSCSRAWSTRFVGP
jgi:hypothetical protein